MGKREDEKVEEKPRIGSDPLAELDPESVALLLGKKGGKVRAPSPPGRSRKKRPTRARKKAGKRAPAGSD